jgi:hypothetical protein
MRFAQDRESEGPDYIKIIAEVQGSSQDTVNALAMEAKKHGKLSVAHAATNIAFAMAQEGKVDIVTHAPSDAPLDENAAKLMKDEGRVCLPTLITEESLANAKIIPHLKHSAARDSIT